MAANSADRLLRIQDWREKAVPLHDVGQSTIATQLCVECIAFYRHCLQKVSQNNSLTKPTFTRLSRNYESLALFAHGYDIAHGGLDDALLSSRRARRCYFESLTSLCSTLLSRLLRCCAISDLDNEARTLQRTLETGTLCLEDTYQDGDSTTSNRSSRLASDDSIDDVIDDLDVDVDGLMSMDSLLTSPADRSKKPPPMAWAPHHAICERVANRFPNAEERVVQRLGRATWDSVLRCIELRKKNEMREHNEEAPEVVENRPALPAKTMTTSARSKDSGLGSSLPTSYAETVMSYQRQGAESVKVPPLPKSAADGVPFDCVVCGGNIVAMTNSAWKNHLFNDLQPYLCIFEPCSRTAPFESRQVWFNHTVTHILEMGEQSDFGSAAAKCPLCLEDMRPGDVKHIGAHLEEIALGAIFLHADVDSDHSAAATDEEEGHEEPSVSGTSAAGAHDNSARDHYLYMNAVRQDDGLFHCPWEGNPSCNHRPAELKVNYDKFVDSHIKPYRCKVDLCENTRFSSTACLIRHEREAHGMHGHGSKPFLCTYEGCERSNPGCGFPRQWNLRDHWRRVHNDDMIPEAEAFSTVRRTDNFVEGLDDVSSSDGKDQSGSDATGEFGQPVDSQIRMLENKFKAQFPDHTPEHIKKLAMDEILKANDIVPAISPHQYAQLIRATNEIHAKFQGQLQGQQPSSSLDQHNVDPTAPQKSTPSSHSIGQSSKKETPGAEQGSRDEQTVADIGRRATVHEEHMADAKPEEPNSSGETNFDDADYRELLQKRREEKRRNRMVYGSSGIRSYTERIGSDTDEENVMGAGNVDSDTDEENLKLQDVEEQPVWSWSKKDKERVGNDEQADSPPRSGEGERWLCCKCFVGAARDSYPSCVKCKHLKCERCKPMPASRKQSSPIAEAEGEFYTKMDEDGYLVTVRRSRQVGVPEEEDNGGGPVGESSLPSEHRASSGAWNVSDDQTSSTAEDEGELYTKVDEDGYLVTVRRSRQVGVPEKEDNGGGPVGESSLPPEHRASSGAWNASDDQTLLAAREAGENWHQIQANYFPTKTPNACRKRHERLSERRGFDHPLVQALEQAFATDPHPSARDLEEIAKSWSVDLHRVTRWFQSRQALEESKKGKMPEYSADQPSGGLRWRGITSVPDPEPGDLKWSAITSVPDPELSGELMNSVSQAEESVEQSQLDNPDHPAHMAQTVAASGLYGKDPGPLTKSSIEVLEQHFSSSPKPSSAVKQFIADNLGVDVARVNNWFQNRRAKEKSERRRHGSTAQEDLDRLRRTLEDASQLKVPELPALRTEDDLAAIDKVLEQMHATVYESTASQQQQQHQQQEYAHAAEIRNSHDSQQPQVDPHSMAPAQQYVTMGRSDSNTVRSATPPYPSFRDAQPRPVSAPRVAGRSPFDGWRRATAGKSMDPGAPPAHVKDKDVEQLGYADGDSDKSSPSSSVFGQWELQMQSQGQQMLPGSPHIMASVEYDDVDPIEQLGDEDDDSDAVYTSFTPVPLRIQGATPPAKEPFGSPMFYPRDAHPASLTTSTSTATGGKRFRPHGGKRFHPHGLPSKADKEAQDLAAAVETLSASLPTSPALTGTAADANLSQNLPSIRDSLGDPPSRVDDTTPAASREQSQFKVYQASNMAPFESRKPRTTEAALVRAMRACDSCRRARTRCSPDDPCKRCVDKGIPCVRSEMSNEIPPPPGKVPCQSCLNQKAYCDGMDPCKRCVDKNIPCVRPRRGGVSMAEISRLRLPSPFGTAESTRKADVTATRDNEPGPDSHTRLRRANISIRSWTCCNCMTIMWNMDIYVVCTSCHHSVCRHCVAYSENA